MLRIGCQFDREKVQGNDESQVQSISLAVTLTPQIRYPVDTTYHHIHEWCQQVPFPFSRYNSLCWCSCINYFVFYILDGRKDIKKCMCMLQYIFTTKSYKVFLVFGRSFVFKVICL